MEGEPNALDIRVVIDAATMNAVRPLRSELRATGLRRHAQRHDGLPDLHDPRPAEEFLVSSRLRRGDAVMGASIAGYSDASAAWLLERLDRESPKGAGVPLGRSPALDLSLGAAIHRRRSTREWSGEAIALELLAAIVRAAAGRGSVPSGGALYPVGLHVAAERVRGLPRGIYRFDPVGEELCRTHAEEQATALLGALAFPGITIDASTAAATILLIARPWRSMRKYGDRGMRYVFLEAGAAAEHVNLAAVALGLGSVDCGSFYDDEVHEILGIDGVNEALVHAVLVGARVAPTR